MLHLKYYKRNEKKGGSFTRFLISEHVVFDFLEH